MASRDLPNHTMCLAAVMDGATAASPGGTLEISPPAILLVAGEASRTPVLARLMSSSGLNVPAAELILTAQEVAPASGGSSLGAVFVAVGPLGTDETSLADLAHFRPTTSPLGRVDLLFRAQHDEQQEAPFSIQVTFAASADGHRLTVVVPLLVRIAAQAP